MQKKYFSKYREPLATLPYLPEIQLESWRWFLADGLKELFRESSPIKDYGGEDLDLEFVDYALDEPKYDEYQAKAQRILRRDVKSQGAPHEQKNRGDEGTGNIFGGYAINDPKRNIYSKRS